MTRRTAAELAVIEMKFRGLCLCYDAFCECGRDKEIRECLKTYGIYGLELSPFEGIETCCDVFERICKENDVE